MAHLLFVSVKFNGYLKTVRKFRRIWPYPVLGGMTRFKTLFSVCLCPVMSVSMSMSKDLFCTEILVRGCMVELSDVGVREQVWKRVHNFLQKSTQCFV